MNVVLPPNPTLDELTQAIDLCQANSANPVLAALVLPLLEVALERMSPEQWQATANRAELATGIVLNQQSR
ncbi:hypothetical protein A6C57_00010 [Fibrella sp. ES10-3-2-2]|nr:hypothetical protein A6C57_00010 [Fibrella sp. ES10-3-2-2]